jgi:hypothetical protein
MRVTPGNEGWVSTGRQVRIARRQLRIAAAPSERYYAFIDESELGDAGEYVARAGFVVRQTAVERIGTQFEAILDRCHAPRHDPRTDCEVKYSPPTTNYFHGFQNRHLLFNELSQLLGANGAVLLAVVVARERMTQWSRSEARDRSLTYLLERVEMCMRHNNGQGCLFLDHAGRRGTELNPIAMATQLIRSGSDFDFKFTRIESEPRSLNSREWSTIQLADLVVGVTVRKVREYVRRRRGEIPASEPVDAYAESIWKPLRGSFMLLPGNDPKRFGLRIFPSGYESGFAQSERPYA